MSPQVFVGGFPASAKIQDGHVVVDVFPGPMTPERALLFSDAIRSAALKAKDEQK